MKYYIVFNEWNYPTESGRDYMGDFNTREQAAQEAEHQMRIEYSNFLAVNNDIYREATGPYHNEKGEIEGYSIHSSQYEEEDMYFRSYIIEIDAWK